MPYAHHFDTHSGFKLVMSMVPNFACDTTSVPAKTASVTLSQH